MSARTTVIGASVRFSNESPRNVQERNDTRSDSVKGLRDNGVLVTIPP
jgi:hypothetical protein